MAGYENARLASNISFRSLMQPSILITRYILSQWFCKQEQQFVASSTLLARMLGQTLNISFSFSIFVWERLAMRWPDVLTSFSKLNCFYNRNVFLMFFFFFSTMFSLFLFFFFTWSLVYIYFFCWKIFFIIFHNKNRRKNIILQGKIKITKNLVSFSVRTLSHHT